MRDVYRGAAGDWRRGSPRQGLGLGPEIPAGIASGAGFPAAGGRSSPVPAAGQFRRPVSEPGECDLRPGLHPDGDLRPAPGLRELHEPVHGPFRVAGPGSGRPQAERRVPLGSYPAVPGRVDPDGAAGLGRGGRAGAPGPACLQRPFRKSADRIRPPARPDHPRPPGHRHPHRACGGQLPGDLPFLLRPGQGPQGRGSARHAPGRGLAQGAGRGPVRLHRRALGRHIDHRRPASLHSEQGPGLRSIQRRLLCRLWGLRREFRCRQGGASPEPGYPEPQPMLPPGTGDRGVDRRRLGGQGSRARGDGLLRRGRSRLSSDLRLDHGRGPVLFPGSSRPTRKISSSTRRRRDSSARARRSGRDSRSRAGRGRSSG